MRGEYNEDSEFPVHEKYTKLGRKKELFEDHLRRTQKSFERDELRTYKCSCGFVFQKNEMPKRCPYCGRGPEAFDKEVSMQDMIDEDEKEE